MAWTETITVDDEKFHPRTDDLWWNESSYITFRVPDRDLVGVLWFYFRPNQKTATGGPMIFDASGSSLNTILHNGWGWHMPMPEGAEMFDFTLANGLSIETLNPQKAYRHTYDGQGCAFDLTFTATCDPHYMRLDKDKVNPGMADFVHNVAETVTTGHYEHFGRMNGTLEVDGETIEVVDSAVFRDRTWGPRPVTPNMSPQRGGYSLGMGPDDSAFNTFAQPTRPWEEDPVDGEVDKIVAGCYVKDGVMATITSGTRRRIAADDGHPLGEIIDATDELGREVHAEGTVTSYVELPGLWGTLAFWWCGQKWNFDGHTDAQGELQDFMTARHFRKWMRTREV